LYILSDFDFLKNKKRGITNVSFLEKHLVIPLWCQDLLAWVLSLRHLRSPFIGSTMSDCSCFGIFIIPNAPIVCALYLLPRSTQDNFQDQLLPTD